MFVTNDVSGWPPVSNIRVIPSRLRYQDVSESLPVRRVGVVEAETETVIPEVLSKTRVGIGTTVEHQLGEVEVVRLLGGAVVARQQHQPDPDLRDERFALMARLAELPQDMVFYTQITMEAAEDTEFLDAMRRANIKGALIGVESVTPEGLKDIYKNFNESGDALVERLKKFRQHGVHVLGSFIFGLPSDRATPLRPLCPWPSDPTWRLRSSSC